MNCKKCQAEMDEGMKFCPACGAAQDEPAKTGLSTGKIGLLVALAIAAIAVVVALVAGGSGSNPVETTTPPTTTAPADSGTVAGTVPADGNHDDVTCKGTYSVTDERVLADAGKVVATCGDAVLTNADLQVYYWMQVYDFLNQYGSYASMFGLDYAQPMDQQLSIDGTLTWQQYFLDSALINWSNYQAMCHAANEAGYVLDQDYLDYLEMLPEDLAESAVSMGCESAEAMVQRDMGAGSSLEGYMNYLNNYYLGYMYYTSAMEQMTITAEEVEAYFDAHAEEYLANGLEKTDETYVDVRHILISPEGGTTGEDGSTVYSDEEWAAAEAKANEILNDWLTKNPTEDGFSVLAEAYSVDGGSASNGGLYTGVYKGQMVEPFENWCFAEGRQYGDYGIVQTNYGYHIMFFVDSELVWYLTAEQDMLAEMGNEFLNQMLEKYPSTIDYTSIVLGNVNLVEEG